MKNEALTQEEFYALPDNAFLRDAQFTACGVQFSHLSPVPFSKPTLWRKVAAGTFPAPIKLSGRVTRWRVCDIRAWLASQ